MSEVRAITIENGEGQRLFGTLHLPAVRRPELPAVVLLSPGVKMRVGPGRLYVPLTEMLVSEGYVVLRFDFFGLGDSEGDLDETMLADVYNNIEVGRYVQDTLCAMRWLRQNQDCKRFILGGLCGGAITALLAAQLDPSVDALLSVGMTVTLASNAAAPGKFLTDSELEWRRRLYLKKMLQTKYWLRFLTFRSEYGVIWHAMKRAIFKPAAKPAVASGPVEQRGNANPMFPPAFLAFLGRGGKALLLFSEKDRLLSEYQEKFATPYAQALAPHAAQIQQHIVKHANHVLSLREWQQEMVDVSRGWLTQPPRAA